MTVVSNTSPLNYLVLIDHQGILPVLFGHVLIPEAVWHELRSPAAPQPVKVVTGTLGVLDLAARRGLVDLVDALKRLERTTFRVTPRLLRHIQEKRSP